MLDWMTNREKREYSFQGFSLYNWASAGFSNIKNSEGVLFYPLLPFKLAT